MYALGQFELREHQYPYILTDTLFAKHNLLGWSVQSIDSTWSALYAHVNLDPYKNTASLSDTLDASIRFDHIHY